MMKKAKSLEKSLAQGNMRAHKKIQPPLSDWILWSILVGTE